MKDLITSNTAEVILELIVQNVFTLLNNNQEKDIQKFIVYLQNLYHMVNGNLNVFVDKFLSTFDLVKVYSSDEEKNLTLKIQKVITLQNLIFMSFLIFYIET